MNSFSLTLSWTLSDKGRCPELLSKQILSMAGVNKELFPLVRMCGDKKWSSIPIHQWPENTPLFSSVILFLGFLPVDKHQFYFKHTHQQGFNESSYSWLNQHWEHERNLSFDQQTLTITDKVRFVPRFTWLAPVQNSIYPRLFSHRHQRLRTSIKEFTIHKGNTG